MAFPLRKVVLFKHGMGFFERQKKVQGDESIDLFFKTADFNDVLKVRRRRSDSLTFAHLFSLSL